MGGAPRTVRWRGIDVDPDTADMLAQIAKDVGDDIYVQGIPGYGSYRTNAASAGTDTGGGHADLNMVGYSDAQCRRLETCARKWGAAAYFRPERRPDGTRYGWQRHVHVLRIDCADLSAAARTQIKDYLAGFDGLSYPDYKHKDTGSRLYTGRRWLQVKPSTYSKPVGTVPGTTTSTPTPPVLKEDTVAITDADAEKIALKVLSYKNAKVNGSKDVYQVITDGSKDSVVWGANINPPKSVTAKYPDAEKWGLGSFAAYGFETLEEARDLIKAQATQIASLTAAVADLRTAVEGLLPKA